jgi:hypothetical protein
MKKANNEQPEKDLQCQAELCGRENRRKRAWLGGNLLGRRYFSLTNDSYRCLSQSVGEISGNVVDQARWDDGRDQH